MEESRIGLSLRYKLLMLLTLVPVVCLGVYLYVAIEEFKSDKIAYVYDSTAAVAQSLGTQVRSEIDNYIERVRPIVERYDRVEKIFQEEAKTLFSKADRLEVIVLFQKNETGEYQPIGHLNKESDYGVEFKDKFRKWGELHTRVAQDGVAASTVPALNMHLGIGVLIGEASDSNHIVVVGLYRAPQLRASFVDSSLYTNILFSKNGQIQIADVKAVNPHGVIQKILSSQTPQGSLEIKDSSERLAGYADVGLGGLKVASIVEKAAALKAVDNLIYKSFIVLIALLSLTVIVGLIASVKLTNELRELFNATKRIAKGDFKIRVEKRTNDEVGGLAEGFNFMAAEVSRLMDETKESARMEGELQTVKVVQETLFPQANKSIGEFKLVGHFEPASECGGDWWHYSQIGDKIFIWIGDATGHGAPAAMVTSAAKAAATILEDMQDATPGKALAILNKAICSTTKGRIMMTFFIASIDLNTGEIVFANASHEPPYILRKSEGKFTKKNLEALVEVNGPRLGDKNGAQYPEGKSQLNPGDAILCYTDGIVDLMSPLGLAWGERGFVRSIVEAGQISDAEARMNKIATNIKAYRDGANLIDDITLFVCQYDKGAA